MMSRHPLSQRARLSFLFLFLFVSGSHGEVVDFSEKTLNTRMVRSFSIAFWEDPDQSELPNSHESFREKLRRLTGHLETALEKPLIEAGFGRIQTSIIDDYESLIYERALGRFHLLHCDPAVYLLPKYEALEPYPYTVLLEEWSEEESDSSGATIWVKKDSSIEGVSDLQNKKVATVHSSSLFGGALQRARLWDDSDTPLLDGRGYTSIRTGAISEGVLRLVTGLGTEEPVEAAFLPRTGLGFLVAAQMLGLNRVEDLPIRILDESDPVSLPGNPLLLDQYLLEAEPELAGEIKVFFAEQRLPWTWRDPGEDRFLSLEESLSPLFTSEGGEP